MEQLKSMKQCLVSCVQGQMGRLGEVDAKELGEAVDMIKDLSEAIYYCTITEAMEEKGEGKEKEHHYYYMEPHYMRDMDMPMGRMYYNDYNYNYNRYYDKYTDGRSEGGRDNRNYMDYAAGGQGNGGS